MAVIEDGGKMKAILVDKEGNVIDTLEIMPTRLTTPKVITVGEKAFILERVDQGFTYVEGDWYKI